MIRIPSTGVHLNADDLSTVRAALEVALHAARSEAGTGPNLATIDGRATVWGQHDPADPEREQRLAAATAHRFEAFILALAEARR